MPGPPQPGVRPQQAKGRSPSVSAYISQALARRDADDELREMLAEIYTEVGQPDASDRAWARQALGLDT